MSGFSMQDMLNLREELAEALRPFANISWHYNTCKAMADALRPHERESFLSALRQARAAITKYEASKS